jgi:hypothetical protein
MSHDTRADKHVVGTLRSVDGTGVVRMEDRYDTGIDDLLVGAHRAAAAGSLDRRRRGRPPRRR